MPERVKEAAVSLECTVSLVALYVCVRTLSPVLAVQLSRHLLRRDG